MPLNQTGGIRPADFDLPLAGNVPDLHQTEQRRQQHVVVNGIGLDAGPLDIFGKRRDGDRNDRFIYFGPFQSIWQISALRPSKSQTRP